MKSYLNIKMRISSECGFDRFTKGEVIQAFKEGNAIVKANEQGIIFVTLKTQNDKIIGVFESIEILR